MQSHTYFVAVCALALFAACGSIADSTTAALPRFNPPLRDSREMRAANHPSWRNFKVADAMGEISGEPVPAESFTEARLPQHFNVRPGAAIHLDLVIRPQDTSLNVASAADASASHVAPHPIDTRF